jgi:hypothetical protein
MLTLEIENVKYLLYQLTCSVPEFIDLVFASSVLGLFSRKLGL